MTAHDIVRASRLGALLERWFRSNGRAFPWRQWRDPYRLVVTEVLLQRTRADAVAAFIGPFLDRFPDAGALAAAPVEEVEVLLAQLGLQRRRAATFRALSIDLEEEPDRAWRDRPGVGQYVSRAIAVGADNAPLAMVDTNFVRVLRRAFEGPWMADYRYDDRLQTLAQALVVGARDPRSVNWAVLDLGALICKPRDPTCGVCPLQVGCVTGRSRSSSNRSRRP